MTRYRDLFHGKETTFYKGFCMIRLDVVTIIILFLLTTMLIPGYASDLKTTIEKSGFYEIEAVLKNREGDRSFTLTAGNRKIYVGVLTDDPIPLGFLSAGAVVDIKTVASTGLSLVHKEVKTVKYAKKEMKTGKTTLHVVKNAGFYGLANVVLSGKKIGDELDIRVTVRNQSPLLRQPIQVDAVVSLDTEIGWLQPGDIIEMEIVGEVDTTSTVLAYDLLFFAYIDIQDQIDQALSRNEPVAYVYPGRYYVNPEHSAGITLKGLSDFTVQAYGVEMILRKPSQRILDIHRCTDVAVKGIKADNDPLLFPQGTIVSVAENGAWIDMELHEGYPIPSREIRDRGMVHDSGTFRRKKNTRDFNLVKIEEISDGTYRLFTGQDGDEHGWSIGDYVSIVNPGANHSCYIFESTRFQLLDATFYSCATHWSITEKYSSESLYKNIVIEPGPLPLLATVNRLRSTHSDGIHSKYATIGPRIEECHFEGLGDDAVAINGGFGVVLANTMGDVVEVGVQERSLFPGDRIRFYSDSGEIIYRKILNTTLIEREAGQIRSLVKNHYPHLKFVNSWRYALSLQLDSVTVVTEGNLLANLDRNGTGFILRNNRVTNGRARGFLVKASDGIIEGNHISHLALPGIVLAAEANDFIEADVVSNVIVRNNIFESVNGGWLNPGRQIQAGALVILFFGKDILGHHNISVENNRFINIPGVNIQINNASNIRINRNVFIESHHLRSVAGESAGVDNSALIWMDRVNGVILGKRKDANTFQNIGKYADKSNLIRYTGNSKNVAGEIFPQ